MHWTSSFTFPIYAVGDGLFMQRVLNAIAALSNSGVLASLGALGLLLGLLMVAMRGISSGGRQVELPSLFMSFILYGIMFGGTARVMVQDVGAPAGVYTNASYTVDNVPFGVAAMGWMVSNISYELSEKLEQAYGLPDDTVGDVMSVGFDRSLDWLTASRYAAMPDLDSTNSSLGRYRYDVVSYLRYCTMKAIDVDPGRVTRMRNAPEVFDSAIGIGFNSSWDTFPYLDPSIIAAAQQDVSCADGVSKLQSYRDGAFFSDFAAAADVPLGGSGTSTAVTEATASWAQVGASLDQATKFYANGLISSATNEALAGAPIVGGQQVANALMVDTADSQRATKFAGEESLFRRMIRPMMAFFESLIYIAAPFMVLALGLGGMGVKMVGRYTLATIWVSMWMPTLAAINMYQETMAGEALSAYLNAPPGSSGAAFHDITTLFGSAHAYSALDDIIATGSLLAASTPAITAFLLFGSSLALNSLWAGMTGAGEINQKMAAPDPVSTAPAMDRSALAKHTTGSGTETVGATATPQLSFGSTDSASAARGLMAMDSTMVAYNHSTGERVAANNMSELSKGGAVTLSNSSSATLAMGRARQALESAGVNLGNTDAATFSKALAESSGHQWSGGATAGRVIDVVKAALSRGGGGAAESSAGKAAASEEAEGAAKGKSPVSGDIGYNATTGANDTDTHSGQKSTMLASQIAAASQHSASVQAAVTGANIAMTQAFASAGSKQSQSVARSADFAKMDRDLSQWNDRYNEQKQYSSSAALNQSVDPGAAFREIANAKFGGDTGAAAKSLSADYMSRGGNADNLRAATEAFTGAGGKGGRYESDPVTAQGAGALLAMYQQMPGTSAPSDPQHQQQMRAHLASVLTSSGVLGVNTGGAATQARPTRDGVGEEAHGEAGDAKRQVSAEHPGVNVGVVKHGVAAAQGSSADGLIATAAASGGMRDVATSAAGGGGEGASMRSSGSADVNESNFGHAAAPIDARAEQSEQRVHDEGAGRLRKDFDHIDQNDSNLGLTVGGRTEALNNAHSDAGWWNGSGVLGHTIGQTGLTNVQAMLGQDAQGNPANYKDNPEFAGTVAAAEAGHITGSPMSHDSATLLAGVLTPQRSQEPLSVDQGKQVAASRANMSDTQLQAVNDYLNKTAVGSAVPDAPTAMTSSVELERVPSVPSAEPQSNKPFTESERTKGTEATIRQNEDFRIAHDAMPGPKE